MLDREKLEGGIIPLLNESAIDETAGVVSVTGTLRKKRKKKKRL
jgi:hypothetical protein